METTMTKEVNEIQTIMRAFKDASEMVEKYMKLDTKLIRTGVYESLVEVKHSLHYQVIDMIMDANLDKREEDRFFKSLEQIRKNPWSVSFN